MKKVLLTALLPLLLGSCHQLEALQRGWESSYRLPNFAQLEADLSMAQTKWAAAGIKNYAYTAQISNFGTMNGGGDGPTIVVRDGKVQGSVTTWPYYTMEQHFQSVKESIARAKEAKSCDQLEIKYDAVDGHLLSSSWWNSSLQDAFSDFAIKTFQKD